MLEWIPWAIIALFVGLVVYVLVSDRRRNRGGGPR